MKKDRKEKKKKEKKLAFDLQYPPILATHLFASHEESRIGISTNNNTGEFPEGDPGRCNRSVIIGCDDSEDEGTGCEFEIPDPSSF